MVFQDPYSSMNPVFRVSHGIMRNLKLHRPELNAVQRRAEAERVFTLVGLTPAAEMLRKFPFEMSGGQRQRVGFAQAVAVRPRPHVVAGLGRDDQLVAVGVQVGGQDASEVSLGGPVGGTVIVGKIEMGHAAVEGVPDDGTLYLERSIVTKVLPEPKRDRREPEAAGTHAPIGHPVISIRGSHLRRGILAWRRSHGLLQLGPPADARSGLVRRRSVGTPSGRWPNKSFVSSGS